MIKKPIPKKFWIFSTGVLLVLLIISIFTGGFSGSSVSASVAGQKVLNFAAEQGADATLVSVGDFGSLYEVTLSMNGQTFPIYVTKDGANLVPTVVPLAETQNTPTNNQQTTEVPKSDRPDVELFIWGYCPYGVQAQGPFAEVAGLLKDSADLRVVPYYDGHGAHETQQNKIQSCIQQLEPDKYWSYAKRFVDEVYPICSSTRTAECDTTESTKLMKSVGIDSTAVFSCVNSQGAALNSAAAQEAQANGVSGSPTLVINGVQVNVARNAESFKAAICSAYNNAPAECGEVLDSSTTAAAGNC